MNALSAINEAVDFCSNDYLGFARDRRLAQAISGALLPTVIVQASNLTVCIRDFFVRGALHR